MSILNRIPFYALLLFVGLSFALTSTLKAADTPNVILIFIDDQGYQDLGCFGSPNIKTPHIDQLAKEGVKFTSFYSASPVCSASRAALQTGSYPVRVGITGVLFPRAKIGLNPEEFTLGDAFKSKGYATGAFGKWHLGHLPNFLPTRHGFDTYFGVPYSNDMDAKERGINSVNGLDRAWKLKKEANKFWDVPVIRDEKEIERPADQTTLTKRYTEEAMAFIEKNKEKPFFVYLPHTMPHIPLFVSDGFYVDDPKLAYKATIEEIDHGVGQIVKLLEKLKLRKNTLIIYTTDNGPWLGKKHHGGSALPLRDGKFTTYEGGMRVPCVMSWPAKMPQGKTCDEIAATIDLLPTFAKLIGAQLPKDRKIDGKDISPLFYAPETAPTPHEMYCFYRGTRLEAIRSGPWKLRLPGVPNRRNKNNPKKGTKKAQLYNLRDDISEKQDVASKNAALVEGLILKARAFDEEIKKNKRPAGSLPDGK